MPKKNIFNKIYEKIQNKRKRLRFRSLGNSYARQLSALAVFCLVLAFIVFGKIISTPKSYTSEGLSGFIAGIGDSNSPDIANLPFNKIEKHEVANAKSTVIYVPQIHKEPTSNAQDSKNDQALVVQKEIFSILRTLVDKNNISYVMDETDLYGPMPQDKINKIETGQKNIADFRAKLDVLLDKYIKSGGDEKIADNVRTQAEQRINAYERNMYLTGGAAVLAANDSKAHVYGSQNQATIDDARSQLQNIVYMENRISELEGSSKSGNPIVTSGSQSSSRVTTGSGEVQKIMSMLSSHSGGGSSDPIAPIRSFVRKDQNSDLSDAVLDVDNSMKKLSKSATFETNTTTGSSNSSAIQSNPYEKVTDLAALKKEYNAAYNKFMKVAKDQRSQEVANNIDRMMTENNQKTGILVFGAQHKDQVIAALNSKGINVIVITPDSETSN